MRTDVIAISSVDATCGHQVPVRQYAAPDPHLAARVARMQGRPCGACRQAAAAEREAAERAASRRIKKGQEPKALPPACVYEMVRQRDGSWIGSLTHVDTTVEAEAAGLMSLVSKLARKFLHARGSSVAGRVAE